MKIGIIARHFPVVSETFVRDHAVGLISKGHRVDVLCRTLDRSLISGELIGAQSAGQLHEWLPEGSRARGLTAIVAALGSFSPAAILRAIRLGLPTLPKDTLLIGQAVRRHLEDDSIVHVHFGPEGEQVALLRKAGLIRNPLVVSLHGYDITMAAQTRRGRYRHLFEVADRIVVTTEFMARRAAALGCPEHKIVRNPIGVEVSHFTFSPRRWAPPETLRLFSTARLVEKKGIEYAIRAVSTLTQHGIPVDYRVVGAGPLQASLTRLANDLGVADRVHLLGAQPREAVMRELGQCHIFLFPSVTAADGDQEGQGIALVEAQACGIPCVATRSGGIPEVLQDGVNGHLVPERDGDAIAAAVESLTQRRKDWTQMAQLGRQWVESQFDLQQHLSRFEALYGQLHDARN